MWRWKWWMGVLRSSQSYRSLVGACFPWRVSMTKKKRFLTQSRLRGVSLRIGCRNIEV